MSGLKALRMRIASVKSTQKITSAMKMVAASKLRRTQERLEAVRPYAKNMQSMIAKAYNACDFDQLPSFLESDASLPHLYIFITADRGLCGSFSTNVMKEFRAQIKQNPNFKAFALGKKGTEFLRKEFPEQNIPFEPKNIKSGFLFTDALDLADHVIALLDAGEVGQVSIIATKFTSVIKMEPATESVVPYVADDVDGDGSDVIFEPKPEDLLVLLFKNYFATRFYQMYLESGTAEHAARMTAMDSATRNAKEMIKALQLRYNRTRQAIITKEIIEIISGAEAL